MSDDFKNSLNSKPARPLDKSNMSNDAATLRALTGMLNNPAITGAVVPKEEKYDGPASENGQTLAVAQTPSETAPPGALLAAQTETPPASAIQPLPKVSLRLLMTGRNVGNVIQAIGAQEFSLDGPVLGLAKAFFGPEAATLPGGEAFLATLRAWGAGVVSTAYPLTPARAVFKTMIHSLAAPANQTLLPKGIDWTKFGKDEGFWIDAVIRGAKAFSDANPTARIVFTGITGMTEFRYFQTLGASHWHVMARPGIGAAGQLSSNLDNDVTKQVSVKRQGPRLRCVWNDTTPPISDRIWRLSDFAAACTPVAVEEAPAISLE